jgi:hypothetical protein
MLPPEITRLRGDTNIAGGCRLQILPVDGVAVMPDEVGGTIPASTPIVPLTGYQWSTVIPTRTTQVFKEDWRTQNGARVSRASLEFVIPKDRAELLGPLWELRRQRSLVLHHDGNGNVKLMGTKAEPAMVTVTELQHGNGPGQGSNQYLLRATSARRKMCPFYLADPSVVVVPPGCPTLQQLMNQSLPADLFALLTSAQAAWFAEHYADATICPTLAQLLAITSNADLFAAISQAQAEYIAAQLIGTIDGNGDEDVVDGGGDETPPPDTGQYNPAEYSPTDYAT